MRRKINRNFFLAAGLFLGLLSCNNNSGSSEQSGSTTDTSTQKSADTSTTTQAPVQSNAMDAVKVAPDLYKTLADSAGIRVLEVNYKPGDSSAAHSHPDAVLYVINGGKAEFTMQDGSKQTRNMMGGMAIITPATTHSVKNVGKTPLKAVLVEVNRSGSASNPDAATDAAKVAPSLYKVLADSAGIRVLMATYKPGSSSALHAHPDNAIYVVEGGTAEFTLKDGSKQTLTLSTGMAQVRAGEMHSVKNTGKTTLKVLLVEVNRAAQ
jgi:quercetin dioxygenase-like cupin family protein